METVLLTSTSDSKREALVNEAKQFAYKEVLEPLKITYSNVLQRYDLAE